MQNRDLREMQCMDIHSKRAKRTTHGGQLCKTKPRGGTNAVLPTGSERCVDHKVLCIADGHIKRTTADESEKGIISSKEKTHMGMKLRKRKPGRERGKDGQ